MIESTTDNRQWWLNNGRLWYVRYRGTPDMGLFAGLHHTEWFYSIDSAKERAAQLQTNHGIRADVERWP